MGFGPLVSATWLQEHAGDRGVALVDCRWRLGEPGAGERAYVAGHLPGAVFLDLDRDLSATPGTGGRHPLPEPAAFEASARRAGLSGGSRVVAYDAGEGGAARLWWLLRHFGHSEAAVLDGGFEGWIAAGGGVEGGRPEIAAGRLEARPQEGDTASADELAARLGDEGLTLLDARAPERHRGEVEPVDPVAGRIPGSANVPVAELAPGGRWPAPVELRARLESAGAAPGRELVAYCGSGVTAASLVLAAELAGLPGARLYPGSWSEWSGRALPVERG